MTLPIKGLQKMSLVDYPSKVACTIFLGGCDFGCGFCHNRDLVLNHKSLPTVKEEELLAYLKEKSKWLDGVCITGGEPLLYKELIGFIPKVRKLGYSVKIDTNGTNPGLLKKLIDNKLIDYVAMDVKNSLEKYEETARAKVDLDKIQESIRLIMESAVDYEFRTTVVPGLHTKESVRDIGKLLKGSKKFAIQNFKPAKEVIEPKYEYVKPFSKEELGEFKDILEKYIDEVGIRA